MVVFRLQCAWQLDTGFPRDQIVITPHFKSDLPAPDADQLCEDLATALQAWDTTAGQVTVKAYDAQGTPPVFPTGSAIRNVGVFTASDLPREIACCLSFYSGQNVPRKRGRLYIPACIISAAMANRPNLTTRTKVGALADIFANLGGTDIDWCIYSRTTDEAHSVSNWWVDDEWDTVRSRGLTATTRLTGTVSE